jgi:hypothetical protein
MLIGAMKRFLAGVLWMVCLSLRPSPAQSLNAEDIVKRSVELTQKDWKQTPGYDYFERDQEPGHSKTYEVSMILGSRYRRLVAIDGKPLPPELAARQDELLQKARTDREHESPQQRQARADRYKKETEQQDLFLNQLLKAFDFTLAGEQKLDSRTVYVVKAHPRRDYHPPNMRAKALTGMEGTLWIDATDYRWARVEAEVKHAVSIEGFFARVEPGTRFVLEQRPVDGEIWLPSHFTMQAHAKVFLLFSHNDQEDSSYDRYHKARETEAEAR